MFTSSLRAAALAAAMFAAASSASAADDPVVATVNGKDIRRSVLIEVQQQIPQARQLPLEMVYDKLLDNVIIGQLLTEQAKKQKLEDDPAVKAAYKDAQMRILQQAYLAKRVDAKVTAAAVRKRYDDTKASLPQKEEVKVRHILVDSEDAAKAVIADLKSGVSFEDEAKAKTKDPSGAANGGDLGYIGKGDTVPEFADAAFKLKPGEVTQTPVKTQFGWHVIKVEDHRVGPPAFEEAEPMLRKEMAQAEVQKVIDDLTKGAQIKRFNVDGSPRAAKQ